MCLEHCADPNARKAQIGAAFGGVTALAPVIGIIVLIDMYRFHAEQIHLKTPKGIPSEEYLLDRREYRLEQKNREKKTPWWQFWKANKSE